MMMMMYLVTHSVNIYRNAGIVVVKSGGMIDLKLHFK